ncbi:unnamed protein product [Lactuca virosa]|uniref:EF hand associated type-2 domain-containing protein n=1 Tax=Lactuca virosa TaxID=75947 RepID=A0AAU9MJK4_9ASTR|nr:unnamed protein product [Lactuca virosa]
MELEHGTEVVTGEDSMKEAEDYLDSAMESAMEKFRRFEEEMEHKAKKELQGLLSIRESARRVLDAVLPSHHSEATVSSRSASLHLSPAPIKLHTLSRSLFFDPSPLDSGSDGAREGEQLSPPSSRLQFSVPPYSWPATPSNIAAGVPQPSTVAQSNFLFIFTVNGWSLISTAIPANDPPVLPEVPSVLAPIRLPDDMFPYCVPITVIDTSSSLQHRDELAEELKTADAIVVTCSYDQPATLDLDHRLCTFWLKYLQDLQVKAPVVVAFCKADIKQPIHLPKLMLPILQRYPQLENYLECSAKLRTLTPDIFLYAQKAVLFPTPPLYDRETKTLKPRCLRALIGVFTLFDSDKDGCLSDKEFNDLQAKCFGTPMEDIKVQCLKSYVEKIMPEGAVIDNKLTLRGFLTNHAELIEHHHPEITWTILKKNEYDNEIKFCCDRLLPPIKRTLDQSVELTTEALEHLRRVFSLFDIRGDGASNARELEDLFSTQPVSLWNEAPSVEVNVLGELSVTGFLSKWALMALLNPV